MNYQTLTLSIFISTLIAGCATQPTSTSQMQAAKQRDVHVFKPIKFNYDPKLPEASNFSRQLGIPAFQCELEATTGSTAVRYRNSQMTAEYSESLMACFKHSRMQGDEAVARLKAAKIPAKQAELSKDLYAKWSAYMMTLSPYSNTDLRAKSEYKAAEQALSTEIKFSE